MGMYLNSRTSYEDYREMAADPYFVDKSRLLGELFPVLESRDRYVCVTRPRRFGKSVMANMIASFFGNAVDARELFASLAIAGHPDFSRHLNQYNVIFIDFSETPERCTSYEAYIGRILTGLKAELCAAYPALTLNPQNAVWDILSEIFCETGERFLFIMDEWDAVFHMSFITEADKKDYLLFLKSLLKGKIYVKLAYMTGILPITKYSGGSELNMFQEYDMATRKKFSEYFGFLDREVDALYRQYLARTEAPEIRREDLRIWYDGYYTATGSRLYNPRSIVCALTDNELSSYWTSSGPYDEIFYYIRSNIDDVRDDLVLMSSGEGVPAKLMPYAAASAQLGTREEIYSAMIVYGLLTYDDGKVYIPNRELMEQFDKLMMSRDSLGYVYRLARESGRMLKATLTGDTRTMAEILKYAHDTESPILDYNSEIELAAVVNLVYLAARDSYRVEREDKAGEGFVDFIFYPERRTADAIILELKIDASPEEAIRQIKNKNYALRLKGKLAEREKFAGRILAAGIGYNRKTKEHACKVEVLD